MALYIFENLNVGFGYSTVENPIRIQLGDRQLVRNSSWELIDELYELSEADELEGYFHGIALEKALEILASVDVCTQVAKAAAIEKEARIKAEAEERARKEKARMDRMFGGFGKMKIDSLFWDHSKGGMDWKAFVDHEIARMKEEHDETEAK